MTKKEFIRDYNLCQSKLDRVRFLKPFLGFELRSVNIASSEKGETAYKTLTKEEHFKRLKHKSNAKIH